MPDYTILLIDYDPRGVERMRAPLEAAGFRVETAADGAEGLAAFEMLHPNVTLIEPMLPKVHGFEVCKQIKASDQGRASAVVIATSVYRGRRYQNQATLQYGADAYLEKPVSEEELLSTVRRLVEGQPSWVSPVAEGPVEVNRAAENDPRAAHCSPKIETEVQVALEEPQPVKTEPAPIPETPAGLVPKPKARSAESLESEIDNVLDDLF